jgi:predicted cupin superfamily sugar epimerase
MATAADYIKKLNLLPHPEGGYYRETFRSGVTQDFDGFDGQRQLSTSIFFLLEATQVSSLHRIKSDEIWYYHDGGNLEIIELDADGKESVTLLGKDFDNGATLQHVVAAGKWFGARLPEGSSFCLVGCQVSPGFDFRDFELK